MNCFRFVLLLIAATFFSAMNAVLTTDSEGRAVGPFRYGHVDSDFTRRILRTAHASGAGEERGFTSSNIKKATGLFASSKTSQEALQRWAKVGRTPDYVFLRLKLDQTGTKLMENINFLAWVKFADDFNTKNPGMATSTISILTARCVNTWVDYVKKFNMANPGIKEVSVITTFTNTFGDENLSKMLEAAARRRDLPNERRLSRSSAGWVDSKSPDEVYLLLNLDTAGSKLLDNPLMITWERFLVDFNKKTTVISTLTQYYGDRKLAGIFIAASKIPSTERVAKQLQTAQLEEWLRAMKDQVFVFRMLSTKYFGKAELSKHYEKEFRRMYK